MDFIKEENNISHRLDFLNQVLDIFFEATTVLSTCFQTRNINRDNFFVLDGSWDITIYDSLCQTFYYSSFTYTSIPDKDRIVLGTTRQDFSHFLNFFVTSNDRIQFAFTCFLGQVTTKFCKNPILLHAFSLAMFATISWKLTRLTVNGEFFRCHFTTIDHVATAFRTETTHVAHQLIEKIIHIVKVVIHSCYL